MKETYQMVNGFGDTVTIIEDYENNVSYYYDDFVTYKFDSAEAASNYAFRKGYRE